MIEHGAIRDYVDEAGLIRLAQSFIRFNTENPPGNEGHLAELLAEYLKKLGLETRLEEVKPGRPNVLARLGRAGARPHLILNGHLDTVPAGSSWTEDAFSGHIADGRLYGRGSADMKGGLAAMVIAIEAIVRSRIELLGSLTFAGVIDEEQTQDGTRHAVMNGLSGDFAIVGEPTELLPVIAHKGDMYVEIETRGTEAHASTPEAGVNAIDHMTEVVNELRILARQLSDRRHPIVGSPTLTVTTIEGGG